MKTIFLLSLVLIITTSLRQALAEDSLVNVDQMSENSMLKKPVDKAVPAPVKDGQKTTAPAHSIADDLKDVLMDQKISALGRANNAVASQYGGKPIVETITPEQSNNGKVSDKDSKNSYKKQKIDKSYDKEGNGVIISQ